MARPKPSFGDSMKGAFRSVRNGSGMNPLETHRQIRQAAAEREAQNYPVANGQDEFYSRSGQLGWSEQFIGVNGYPTTTYPHVHVTHHANGGVIDVVASRSPSDKPMREQLPAGSDGNAVNAAINRMIRYL